jgi:hypothetical protein
MRRPRTTSTTPSASRSHLVALVLVSLVVSLGVACGSDNDADTDNAGADDASDVVADGDEDEGGQPDGDGGATDVPEGFDVPEALPLADGLIPELAAIPVPDGDIVYERGSANTEEMDPRQTAVQQLHFTMPVVDVATFYLQALPDAGFEIEGGEGSVTEPEEIPDALEFSPQLVIMFVDPDGNPGNLLISPGAFAEAQMNINVFRGGVR